MELLCQKGALILSFAEVIITLYALINNMGPCFPNRLASSMCYQTSRSLATGWVKQKAVVLTKIVKITRTENTL